MAELQMSGTNSTEKVNADLTEFELSRTNTSETIVEGTTQLYDGVDGKLRYVPMPTADPQDPLNMTPFKKVLAICCICLFGAMSGAAESILAALMPVFVFEYNGFDPHVLGLIDGLPAEPDGSVNPNPVDSLGFLQNGPPIWQIYLLSSLPVLVNGVSNYFLVPLSIAVGRRPVVLVCGLMAWIGAIWAAKSQSLGSHLGARCFMGLGAGTLDSIIPLIVQDMAFIHWRNRAVSFVWASQGIIIVSLGVGSPRIIQALDWRWMYQICGIISALTWVLVILFVPESRYDRTTRELRGYPLEPLPEGEDRPRLDTQRYAARTFWTDLRFYTVKSDWPGCWEAAWASCKSLIFPNVFIIVLIQAMFIAISLAAGQTASPVLMTEPNSWPFLNIGFSVMAIFVACPIVWLFAGYFADRTSNYLTKRMKGKREPEVHLVNCIIPLLAAIIGCILFGYSGSYPGVVGWGPFVVGIGLIAFGFLSFNAIMSVYVMECFPEWAGPVIVNVSSFRNILGFGFSFRVVDWVAERGYLGCFSIYAGCIAFISITGLGAMAYWGKTWRKMCGRAIKKRV